jgi:hypothetical protein
MGVYVWVALQSGFPVLPVSCMRTLVLHWTKLNHCLLCVHLHGMWIHARIGFIVLFVALFTPAVGMLATAGLPSACGTYPPGLEYSANATLPWVCPPIRCMCVCVGKRATDAPM